MQVEPDSELVERLRQGQPAAFDEVFNRWHPRLYSFLARLTGDRALAEELAQETWLRLARSALRLQPQTKLWPWLLTVARNLVISQRRWSAVDLQSRLVVLWDALSRTQPTPFEHLAATQSQKSLERALAALPMPYREVLLLVAVEGLEPAQAAQVLKVAPEAARKRLSRARAMLEAALTEPTSNDAKRSP